MRLVTILALMAVVGLVLCPPALPKDKKKGDQNLFETAPKPPPRDEVSVTQGSKKYEGWMTDSGRIFIERNGKVIMDGWVNRTGAVTLYSTLSDDNYVGQVNPMGNGLLMSPKTSDTIRIEVRR
jgi:hypothetical protein